MQRSLRLRVDQSLSGVISATVIVALALTSPTASISSTRRAFHTLYIKNHLPPVSCPGYLQLPILITMTNPLSSHTISVTRHASSVIPTKIARFLFSGNYRLRASHLFCHNPEVIHGAWVREGGGGGCRNNRVL